MNVENANENLATIEMVIAAAKRADIAIPKHPENLEGYNAEEYPHWHVYTLLQLGAQISYPNVHFSNAKVVASIPKNEIVNFTLKNLLEEGFTL